MLKRKLLNASLLISSLVGYMQWGTNQKAFLYESEWQVLSKLWSDPLGVIHPLTIIPLVGQLALLVTLTQKQPARVLTFIGIGSLGLLLLFLLLAGILSGNVKTIASVMPFLFFAGWIIKNERSIRSVRKPRV